MSHSIERVAFHAFMTGFFVVLAIWMYHEGRPSALVAVDVTFAVVNGGCVLLIRRTVTS